MENITFEEAMQNIANSIVKEQNALADLLSVEGTKVDKFIELNATPEELLEVNNSVTDMVNTTNTFDEVLTNKLILVTKYLH